MGTHKQRHTPLSTASTKRTNTEIKNHLEHNIRLSKKMKTETQNENVDRWNIPTRMSSTVISLHKSTNIDIKTKNKHKIQIQIQDTNTRYKYRCEIKTHTAWEEH